MSDSYANQLIWFVEFFNWVLVSFIFNNFFLLINFLVKRGTKQVKKNFIGSAIILSHVKAHYYFFDKSGAWIKEFKVIFQISLNV